MKYRDDIEHDYDLPNWLWWLLGVAMLAVIALISTAQGQILLPCYYDGAGITIREVTATYDAAGRASASLIRGAGFEYQFPLSAS